MNIRIYVAAGLLIAILCLGWTADHYHDKAVVWRDSAHQSQKVARQQANTITDMNQRQQRLATLDKTHTEALNAAESENDALRRQLAAGTRRMYVQAKCPSASAGAKATPGRMGDATRVELTGITRRNILDIRAGIIRDQEKLTYLQEYVQTQCLK